MLAVACHSCSHRFERTAAQVLSEGRCPHCASTDIDLADNVPVTASSEIQGQGTCQRCHEHKVLAGAGVLCQDCLDAIDRGEPLRLDAKVAIGLNPFCASGLHTECSGFMCGCTHHVTASNLVAEQFKAMLPDEIAANLPDDVAVSLWNRLMTEPLPTYLLDIYDSGQANPVAMSTRRARELATNWLIDQQIPEHQAALKEPTDSGVPGSKKCPACGENQYDGSSCSKCGYTPDDGVYASVKNAGHGDPGFCEVCGQAIRPGPNKGSFVHYDSTLEMAHSAEPNQATLSWYTENAPEYLASRHAAIPTGRSDYQPGRAQMNDATPQTYPDQFSSEDILAEVKYLMRLNQQHGSNALRTMRYLDLMKVLNERGFTGTASLHTAYDTHCPYCGQEGCSPNCPGPSSTGTCPSCGGGMSDGKCNDPQGCGYGWDGDRGLTFDGEPRFSAKVREITDAVLGSNPGMSRKTASAIAEETIRRYPKVLG